MRQLFSLHCLHTLNSRNKNKEITPIVQLSVLAMFSTQNFNPVCLDSPPSSTSWPRLCYKLWLTEAHLGAVQILICASLLVPLFVWVSFSFFLFFFTPHTPPPSLSLTLSSFSVYLASLPHTLTLHGRCRREIFQTHFVVWGQCTASRWAAAEQTPMYANLNTKQPRMFSI